MRKPRIHGLPPRFPGSSVIRFMARSIWLVLSVIVPELSLFHWVWFMDCNAGTHVASLGFPGAGSIKKHNECGLPWCGVPLTPWCQTRTNWRAKPLTLEIRARPLLSRPLFSSVICGRRLPLPSGSTIFQYPIHRSTGATAGNAHALNNRLKIQCQIGHLRPSDVRNQLHKT